MIIIPRVGSLVTWGSAAGRILGVVEKIAERRCADDVVRPWIYVREYGTNNVITLPSTSCVNRFEVLVENWNDVRMRNILAGKMCRENDEADERMCREYDEARELYYA